MNIRFGFLTMVFFILAYVAYGQQEAQVTQNMFNYTAVNPGYYGMRNGISVTGLARQQYVGLQDFEGEAVNPESFFLSIDAPLKVLHGGVGATIYNDNAGYMTNVGIELGYSYHATLGYGDLGIGFNIGFFNETIDFSSFNPIDESDPILNERTGEETDMLINFSFGGFYQVEEEYYLGVATTTIAESEASNTRYIQRRHYYLMGGYHYQITPEYDLIPNFMVTYDGASTQYYVNSTVEIKDRYWAGLGYRFEDGITANVGLLWKDFKFGYAYDITTSRLAGAGSGGSHEIVINYLFKLEIEKDNNKYRTTRYL